MAPRWPCISSTKRARRCAVLPDAISISTSGRDAGGDRRGGEAEIGGPHDLALADRDAAENLRQIFAEPDADQQLFDLGEPPARLHARGIGGELPHRLDVGREPGEPVGGALLAVEQASDDAGLRS